MRGAVSRGGVPSRLRGEGQGEWRLPAGASVQSSPLTPALSAPGGERGEIVGRLSRILLLGLALLVSVDAHACTVCWGNPDDPMVQGANSGIWVLLAIIGFVQLGFVALFWSFWRRARDQRRFRESLRVIHPFDPVDRSVNQGGIRS